MKLVTFVKAAQESEEKGNWKTLMGKYTNNKRVSKLQIA